MSFEVARGRRQATVDVGRHDNLGALCGCGVVSQFECGGLLDAAYAGVAPAPICLSQSMKPAHVARPNSQPGGINRNGQTLLNKTDAPGTYYMRHVWIVQCAHPKYDDLPCGHIYGSNSSDFFKRKCPVYQASSFEDGSIVPDIGSESMILSGSVRSGANGAPVARLHIAFVGLDGFVHRGTLVRGQNPVDVTFEFILRER